MKKMHVVAFLIFCVGCASSDPNYFPSTGLKMPPKKSANEVEVRSLPPSRAFFPLGMLDVGGTHSWGKIIRNTSEQGAQIGADFVWLVDTSVQTENVWIPGFSTFSASGSAYGYGYGNWFSASANSQASGFSVGPHMKRVERGTIRAIAGVYYPARLGVSWDKAQSPKCVIKEFGFNDKAQQAGLLVGDEVIAIDSIGVNDDNFPRHMLQVQPGRKVSVTVIRNGQRVSFDVETIPN